MKSQLQWSVWNDLGVVVVIVRVLLVVFVVEVNNDGHHGDKPPHTNNRITSYAFQGTNLFLMTAARHHTIGLYHDKVCCRNRVVYGIWWRMAAVAHDDDDDDDASLVLLLRDMRDGQWNNAFIGAQRVDLVLIYISDSNVNIHRPLLSGTKNLFHSWTNSCIFTTTPSTLSPPRQQQKIEHVQSTVVTYKSVRSFVYYIYMIYISYRNNHMFNEIPTKIVSLCFWVDFTKSGLYFFNSVDRQNCFLIVEYITVHIYVLYI